MKLLEEQTRAAAITVMVQKEAAQRICAPAGTRQCGAVTIAVRYYCEPQMLFEVSAGSFLPAPKVDSAVIQLKPYKNPPWQTEDTALFFRVVKSAFAQRRKTLLNALASGLALDKEEICTVLKAAMVGHSLRAEQLSMEQFASVTNTLYGYLQEKEGYML